MAAGEAFWRILLIEDDEDDYILIQSMLREIKGSLFDLHWVNHNGSSVELICSGTFDACIIDYVMQPMSGLDILKEVVELCAGAPVILITGWSRPGLLDEAKALGVNSVLNKNHLSIEILEKTISELMAGR